MMHEEKIIVSFTTWKKRIHLACGVFVKMLSQTLVPHKIILNLSSDEFTNKEKDLPRELLKLIEENKDICEINWVKENTKVWKKFMPILDRFPNDVIIPIDDDIEYPSEYVEIMYSEYLKRGGKQPIVCYPNLRENNIYSHSGCFSLVKKEFFGKYLNEIYNGLILKTPDIHWQSDEVYSYCIWLNKNRYYYTTKIDGRKLYDISTENKINSYSNYKDGWKKLMETIKSLLTDFIKKKYGVENLLEGEVIVNFTTWKGRDWCVPIMMESLKKQTKKPDRIICWLSKDEYEGKIPDSLAENVKNGDFEIKWVDGNIYAHKRWETFKENFNCYNIMVDDDLHYPCDYVETLYKNSMRENIPTCYYSRTVEYRHGRRDVIKFNQGKHAKNALYSGLCCFPPCTFPIESFEHTDLRDKYLKLCDDSWIGSWLVKNNIAVYGCKEWKPLDVIENSQKLSIWETHNNKKIGGVLQKVINVANGFVCADAVENAKKIWPNFETLKYCDKELLKEKESYIKKLEGQRLPKQQVFFDITTMYNIDETETRIRRKDKTIKIRKKPIVKIQEVFSI